MDADSLRMAAAFAVGLIGALVLTPLAIRAARRFGALDRPDGQRKIHKAPVPLLGGVAVFLTLAAGVTLCAYGEPNPGGGLSLSTALVLSAGILCLVGCWDDVRGMRVRLKLAGQTLATLPVVLAGYYVSQLGIGPLTVELGWLGVPLTMLWLVAGINALNLLDGMDGMAGIVGVTLSLSIALIAGVYGMNAPLIVSLVFAGSLLGFLAFNAPPARIYLGDAGSMMIGFVVAFLALRVGTFQGITAPSVPLVLISVPLLDSGLAVVRRSLSGKPIWQADRGHMHHRLLERGMSTWQSMALVGGLCLATGLSGYVAAVMGRQIVATLMVIVLFLSLVPARFCGHHEWTLLKAALMRRFGWGVVLEDIAEPSELGSAGGALELSPAHSWRRLVEAARRRGVQEMDVTIGEGEHTKWAQRWTSAAGTSKPVTTWTLDTRFDAAHGTWCKIRTVAEHLPLATNSARQELSDLLSEFGNHWATAAPSISGPKLRVVSEDSPAVGDDRSHAA